MPLLALLLAVAFSVALAGAPPRPCSTGSSSSFPFCNVSLPIPVRARALVSLLTLDEKISQLDTTAAAVNRLGIPAYEWWSESLHGLTANGPGVHFGAPVRAATSFPQVILTAASFNRTLWRAVARAIAVEARAMHNAGQAGLTFWAPNINVFRDPRWGRGQETPGEDPLVCGEYSVEYVSGFQGEYVGDGEKRMMLSACCKHYTAYDLEKWGKFARYTFNAKVTEQDLEDTFLPPFKNCIEKGHASCLMCAYNQVNGVPMCAHGDLLQKAREEWGFNGYVTSDCDAVAIIYENQTYSASPEDSVADVLKAGMDVNCGTYLLKHTKSAIEKGKLQEADIDRALVNLFTVQMRLGLFDGNRESHWFSKLGANDICTAEHRKLAMEAVREGLVLLKNDASFLPLQRSSVARLAIIGPGVNDTGILGGDYTGVPCDPASFLAGAQAFVQKTVFATGCKDVPCNLTDGFDEAVEIARESDLVVLILGLNLTEETEDHDRTSLLLPGKQQDLADCVASASKNPVVLVLMGGGPLDVSFAKHDARFASILWIGYPGEMGGKVLWEAVFGEFNPGGRLPMTWYPESFTDVPMSDMNMRPDPSRGYPGRTYRFYTGPTVYDFGSGLSYSNYSYTILSAPRTLTLPVAPEQAVRIRLPGSIDVEEISSCESSAFAVRFSVLNRGPADGSHGVLLFARPAVSIDGFPRKQLIGFERVRAAAGVPTEAEIVVNPCEHMSAATAGGRRVLYSGRYVLMLGDVEHQLLLDW